MSAPARRWNDEPGLVTRTKDGANDRLDSYQKI
jgi:hypothetical protein